MATDPVAMKVLHALREEFPEGESQYHEWFLRSLGIFGDPVRARKAIQAAVAKGRKTQGNAYRYGRAFTVSPPIETIRLFHRLATLRAPLDGPPDVLDPFAGGGSIPFEASRYGCNAIAGELNPVATAILQGTVALPAMLGPGFEREIVRWGNLWAERVERRLERFYPVDEPGDRLAYIWAHSIPCPTTGQSTPLAPDFWLARGKGDGDRAVRLEVDRGKGTYILAIAHGRGAATWGDRSTYKNGVGTSIWTGETFSGDYIHQQALAGRIGAMLLAVSITRPGVKGRQFRTPNEADLAAVAAADAELQRRRPGWEVANLIPDEPILPGWKTDEPRRMGLYRWSDLFTPRQLLADVTALEVLREVVVEARGELGDERARALALYLAFALDKAADYNGMLSSWHASRTTVRNTFDRHDFAYKWTFAEFDAAHALFPWVLQQVQRTYRGTAGLAIQSLGLTSGEHRSRAQVFRGTATAVPLKAASVDAVVTDPPYYDNVMYAECSDYFYVWLKRALQDSWPEYCDLMLTDKENEAVANPSLFKDVAEPASRGRRGNGRKTAARLADARYEQLLTASFAEAHRVLKPDGVLTVMFTHKRVDAWDTLGMALLGSGFTVDSSWPVHTESEHSLHQAKKNSASSTIILTCRKRIGSESAYWEDIRRDVEKAADDAATRFADDGLAGVDLTLATFGPVLSVLSQRWPVYTGALDEAGNPQVLRPEEALDLARMRVAALKKRNLLGGRDVQFDGATDWYLLAWSDFAAATFPAGEALKLSLATHLDLQDLSRTYRLVKAVSGEVTILTPAQRHTLHAIDPDAATYPNMIDALHALMLIYDEQGLAAAKAWLSRNGKGDDRHFADLVEAAIHAIPRTRDKHGFVRPEARILDSLRTALFEGIRLPLDEETEIDEALLFNGDEGETSEEELAEEGYEEEGDEEGDVG